MSGKVAKSATTKHQQINIVGANVHNLKNVSVSIPRNSLVVVTGVSGSGKSSLAFDTLYAEGQRRFVESLSAYARQFLDRMSRPDVEQITGIPPAIAIEQKTVSKNPRSTVGTTTEVYDYLRLLYGRIGTTHCASCDAIVRKDNPTAVADELTQEDGRRLLILIPISSHGDHSAGEELRNVLEKGFLRLWDTDNKEILDLDTNNIDSIAEHVARYRIVGDRLITRGDEEMHARVAEALEIAFAEGMGRCSVYDMQQDSYKHFSTIFECADCGIEYDEPEPRLFSFNNPRGACPECQGFGRIVGIDDDLVFPDLDETLASPKSIAPFSTPKHLPRHAKMLTAAAEHGIRIDVPLRELTPEEWKFVREGGGAYKGTNAFFAMLEKKNYKMHYRILHARYRGYTTCPECSGSRLRLSARQVFVQGATMADIVKMRIEQVHDLMQSWEFSPYEEGVAGKIVEELRKRVGLLNEIGVNYLTLDRLAHTLSGGESQRLNLATSIGSALVGALYVLDEPSIGLHPRDTQRLIAILKRLRDLGNTVVVVEHDADIMRAADHIIDMGPKAGEHGGEIVFEGAPTALSRSRKSTTSQYLRGTVKIDVPSKRREASDWLTIVRPRANNLKLDQVQFGVGILNVVTGVSGSGKSTLVNDVVTKELKRVYSGESRTSTLLHGFEHFSAFEFVDQAPIGRSPRSTPATYTKAFDAIRDLFSQTQAARQLGWKPGHFSFNVPGGRCQECEGDGVVKVEMQFLADVELQCEECGGTRYRREARNIKFKSKSIVDVLAMTVDEALEFFAGEAKIVNKLQPLADVGLGYVRLGQPGNTLSGGESQRIKLAGHLAQRSEDGMLFILDEPTTGLHFNDIAKLLECFEKLIAKGHTLVVIEHNVDVVKCADRIVDLGPDAGPNGGQVVFEGTPEDLVSHGVSKIAPFLKEEIQ